MTLVTYCAKLCDAGWQRDADMKLGHVVKILTDMSTLVEVPQHIQQLQERQVRDSFFLLPGDALIIVCS